MNKILSKNEIKQFREEGAVFLKNKFDIIWINKIAIISWRMINKQIGY